MMPYIFYYVPDCCLKVGFILLGKMQGVLILRIDMYWSHDSKKLTEMSVVQKLQKQHVLV